jgi:hypothetical protein
LVETMKEKGGRYAAIKEHQIAEYMASHSPKPEHSDAPTPVPGQKGKAPQERLRLNVKGQDKPFGQDVGYFYALFGLPTERKRSVLLCCDLSTHKEQNMGVCRKTPGALGFLRNA